MYEENYDASKHVQILGLSATMNNPEKFCSWIENVRKSPFGYVQTKKVVSQKHYQYITIAKSTMEKFPQRNELY